MNAAIRLPLTHLLCAFAIALPLTAAAAPRDLAPIADEVVQKLVKQRQTSAGSTTPQLLNQHLDELIEIARPVESRASKKTVTLQERQSATQSQRMLVVGKRSELSVLRQQLSTEFTATRNRLTGLHLTDKVKAWDDLQSKVEARFERLDRALAAADSADNTGRAGALAHLQSELHTLRGVVTERAMAPSSTPIPTYRQEVPPAHHDEPASATVPQYQLSRAPSNNVYAFLGNTLLAAAATIPPQASSCGYSAADLSATPDAPQTPEIQALAAKLGYSPARIFEYVSNTIQFQPYYGSLKGAVGALRTLSGGPTDQASLLIALLRASNIPARYVRGTVQLIDAAPAADGGAVAHWVGAKSYQGAASILANGSFNAGTLTNGTQNIGVQLSHVWVEACVPYGHYRGAAVDNSGFRWIPLDASFKDKAYQAGIATNVAFDYSGYLAARTNGPDSLPQEKYTQQVAAAMRASDPNATVQDAPYQGTPKLLSVDILPASLPFEVVNFTNWPGSTSPEAAQLPGAHRYRFAIGGLGQAAAANLYLPDVALSRVTVSFKGTTPGDQTALDAWRTDNNINSAIPCTLNVVPVLMVEGVDQSISGSSVGLCSINNVLSLTVNLDEVSATPLNGVTYNNIGAANWHALQAYAFQGSDSVLRLRAASLLASVTSTANPSATPASVDATEGEFLNLVGLKYMRYISDAAKNIGGIDGGSGESGNHLGLASSQMKVQYLFDLPFAVNRIGFLVDMPGLISRSVDLASGASVWKTFQLAGISGSAYEAFIWQENARLDAVSTVRGLQFANETGVGTVVATSANWASLRAQVSVYPGATADDCTYNPATLQYPRCLIDSSTQGGSVQALINLGYTVTLPKTLLQYGDWKGYVYTQERQTANPADPGCPQAAFCAGYIINKLAGGATIGTQVLPGFNTTLNTGFVFQPEASTYLQLQSFSAFTGVN